MNEREREQQEQQRERQREKQRDRQRPPADKEKTAARSGQEYSRTSAEPKIAKRKKSKPQLKNFTVVEEKAGANGEKNLDVKWEPMLLPEQNAVSSYFKITTIAGNSLSAKMEQASYKKQFNGKGKLETSYAPVAPHGTNGSIIVIDTTTGEKQKITWQWHWTYGKSFWELVKDIINAMASGFRK